MSGLANPLPGGLQIGAPAPGQQAMSLAKPMELEPSVTVDERGGGLEQEEKSSGVPCLELARPTSQGW